MMAETAVRNAFPDSDYGYEMGPCGGGGGIRVGEGGTSPLAPSGREEGVSDIERIAYLSSQRQNHDFHCRISPRR